MRVNVPAELLRQGYTLLRRRGGGSTAEVFEARNNETGRKLAIKVSRADIPQAEAVVARMQTEWNVGRGLRHPHLVAIMDGGTFDDGRAWLAMELLEGHDLLDELEARGALEPLRAVHIARQVCEALQVLHRRGAVHRDIKPENVFLSTSAGREDLVKVIDLGILALPEDDPERLHEPTGRFIMGTPLYLAPEQARGQPPDPRTDLYAVGGVLYHMLTGHPPFQGQDPTEIVARHVHDEVPPIDEEVIGLPESLVELVHRCLQKQRDDRPLDAAALIGALDRCASDLAGRRDTRSLKVAPLPPVPPPGRAGEWVRFGEQVERAVQTFWTEMPPDPVIEGLNARREVLKELEQAQLEADVCREQADVGARQRIEARERLQRRQRRLTAGLERHRRRHLDALADVDAAEAALDALDERYAAGLSELRELARARMRPQVAEAIDGALEVVEAVLSGRPPLLATLAAARLEERKAAEGLSLLRVEEIDLQRAFADQELEEREEGDEAERAAAAAIDRRTAAERIHEAASVRLLAACAAGLAELTGSLPPSGISVEVT